MKEVIIKSLKGNLQNKLHEWLVKRIRSSHLICCPSFILEKKVNYGYKKGCKEIIQVITIER